MSAFLISNPTLALFLALALGYLVGAIKIGQIQLGGICGTLIVALILGQSGVRLGPDIKSIAFALFIFALGYTGGPQFFANIRKGWRFGILSVVEVVVVLAVVMSATVLLSLNAGAAAGVLAGSATESAVIGTATEAVTRLALAPAQITALQGQIATAYSITYVFGLITIVLFISQLAPLLLGINLKQASADLARHMGETEVETGAQAGGQAALPNLVGRAFEAGPAAGATVGDFEARTDQAVTIVRLRRGDGIFAPQPTEKIQAGDTLLLIGRRAAVVAAEAALGPEVARVGVDLPLVEESYILGKPGLMGHTLADARRLVPPQTLRGAYIRAIRRMSHAVPVLPQTVLQTGDVVELYGPERAVARAGQALGRAVPPPNKTDFIMLGLGIIVGFLIGMGGVTLGGVHVTLGTGGGCLVSGLVFGWYSSRHAGVGAFPPAAAQVLKDFGLATFIAAAGFAAGPEVMPMLREYGIWLPVTSILAVLLPASLSLFIGHKILKLEAPLLLGAIAGQQCSTPAISALINASGNSTALVGYTVTYAISNVLLPLLGPVVVGLAFHMA